MTQLDELSGLRTSNENAKNAKLAVKLALTHAGVTEDIATHYGDVIVDSLLLAMWDEIENEADYHETAQPASMTDAEANELRRRNLAQPASSYSAPLDMATAGDEDKRTQAEAQLVAAQLALLDKLDSLGVQVGDVRKELADMVAATFDLARVGTNAETDAISYGAIGQVDERTAQYMDHLRSVRG